MDTVYVETSVISHATALPSSDPATAVLQDQARRWMSEQAPQYELVTSQIVLAEARRGDPAAAKRRLAMLANIPVLDDNPDMEIVADQIVARALIPPTARLDAMHVAAAGLAGVKYLLTQNLPAHSECSRVAGFVPVARRPGAGRDVNHDSH